MKPEIKERISQIQKGIEPKGYNKTDYGIFPEEWEQKTFGDIFDFYGSISKSRDELGNSGIPYLHYGDMHRSDFKIASYNEYSLLPRYDMEIKGDETYLLKDGDVVFLDASEDVDGTTRSVVVDNPENQPFLAGLHTFVGKEKSDFLDKYYKQYLTLPEYVRKQIMRLAVGFKVYGINRNDIKKIYYYVPSKPEQEKIANILKKWDRAIELQEQLIEKLEVQRHGALQRIVSNNKWNKQSIGTFAKECKTRNENGKCKNVKSVSNKYGFISQNEQFSKTVASSDVSNYKIVKYKNIAYNPSRINVGSIAVYKESDEAIVSPMYVVFECCDIEPELLCLLLSTDKSKYNIIAYCTGSVRNSLNFDDLCKIKINMPDKKAQKNILDCFNNIDENIRFQNKKLELLKQQQKSMQQLLLTGIVRLKK